VNWLSLKTLLKIHGNIIEATGGNIGLRDKGLLESALFSPLATFGGEDLYIDIYQKVAVMLYAITNNHPFVDGNKRTALTTLEVNGYKFKATQSEVVEFMLGVATGKTKSSKSLYKKHCQSQ